MNVKSFKNDCLLFDPEIVFQKNFLEGNCYFFEIEKKITEFQFKKDISNSLGVHIRDVVIVGSGKLGFSIKPEKDNPGLFQFTPFDGGMKKSDLDIAIISSQLFDEQLIRLFGYTSQYYNMEIWNKNKDRNALAKYVLKGWLKPEYTPKGYKISEEIQATISDYKMKFGRDVNIGIYKSWDYFENYHIRNIRNINLNLIANG